MDNEQQVKGINYTNEGSVGLGEIRELSEEEEAELYEDIEKLQRKENEKFLENMKNVLEIEKKNAVKEFAEKLKKKVHNYYPSIDSYCMSRHVILVKDIDELLKEYEKCDK